MNPKERLQGIDIARFLGLVGMALVNFRIAALVGNGGGSASTLTDALEGRAAALFVILAGIGFSLGEPHWTVNLKRATVLLVVDLCKMLVFDADILHFLRSVLFGCDPVRRAEFRHTNQRRHRRTADLDPDGSHVR